MTRYPEHERLLSVKQASQDIGEFLEWLTGPAGVTLCETGFSRKLREAKGRGETYVGNGMPSDERFYPVPESVDWLLAQYFGIDLAKIEAEKRAMLEEMRREAA